MSEAVPGANKALRSVHVYCASDSVGVMESLRDLFAHRELLLAWTGRELKVRYKLALLGATWAVLQPLSMMIIFSIIFTVFMRVPTDGVPYPIFSFVALAPWTMFSTAISMGAPSIINNMALITKIRFPREILPLANVGAAMCDFCISLLLLAGMMIFYGVPLRWPALVLPLLVVIQLALMIGLVLLASALIVRLRDVRFVVPLLLQLWMYATPIIYPLSLVPERWRWVLKLNPMTSVIEGYRSVLLFGRFPVWSDLALSAVVALVFLAGGYLFFKHTEVWFADIM